MRWSHTSQLLTRPHSCIQLTGLTALLIYHCYMGMASIAVGLMTGAVGFLAAMWFVFQIFGSLKFD